MSHTDSSRGTLKHALGVSSWIAGVAVLGLGLVVLAGWYTGNRTLVQVLPSFVPMQYNTALGFVFCGAGLLLRVVGRDRWAAAAGGLVCLIGALTLIEYVGQVDLGIDELFMKHDITVETSHPGRMAPNTAVCFVLTGLWAVLAMSRWPAPRQSIVAVLLASLALGLGVVAFSGYFTRLETAYGWGNLTRMAVHTSAGFIVVSLGLLCLQWSRDVEGETWLPRWMPVPAAVAILTATLCFWQALVAESARIHRQYEDLSSLSNLATVMLAGGVLLALTLALAAYLAQTSSRRARDVAQSNLALQAEIATRQEAERALKTHRDNLEQVVAERTQELDRARQEAEAANRAKSEFLSHMSHELRTPLNGILGYAQILQRDPKATDRQRGNLGAIVNCGDHLLALINDVLDLSKIEAGRLEVDEAAVDLHDLIQGVGNIVGERATRKGVAFVMDVSPEVPRGVVTDAAKLRQILVNLLGNAVKFTDKGQVTLRASESPRGRLRFDVVDTGVGMSEEEIADIFDPFKQVEAGKAAGGTGLGLAITKRLAEALGASVDVRSDPGKGSTFSVSLPLVEAATDDWSTLPADGSFAGELQVLADGQACTILVADDRDTNRHVLQGMLEGAGFCTRLASDGDEALDQLRAHDDVALVLMDIRMPRMGGIEALGHIRKDEKLRDLKVIAVTASVFPEFRKKALESGFDDFLPKPFRVEDLLHILKKHLDIEFVVDAATMEDAPAEEDGAPSGRPAEAVSPEAVERLRDALRIKNLTAIKAVARELSAAPATKALGNEIASLAGSFNFQRLATLLDELEKHDGPG